MKSRLGAGFAILAVAAALAACGGTSGTTATSPAASTGAPPASATAPASVSPTASPGTSSSAAVDLKTASSSAGTIVVDAKGMSVYFFTKDTKGSGTSACTDACLKAWPPVTSASETPAADGVAGALGTIHTADGKHQVTLDGLPLYYYAKDGKPGDVLGQGVNNVWYLADPSGSMIQAGGGAAY